MDKPRILLYLTMVFSLSMLLSTDEYANAQISVLGPPTNLTARVISSSQINLSWNAPSDTGGSAITGYKIERSTDGGITWGTIVSNSGTTATTYSNTGLSPSTTYTYRVSAITLVLTSSPSNTASATASAPAAAPPSAPTGLGATTVSSSQINLSWTAPASNGGSAITGYKIYRSSSSGTEGYLTTLGNITSYNNTGLASGHTYFYKITAVNSIGTSPQSNEASASTVTTSTVTIYKIQSGLVATDSLTTGNMSNWVLYGTAVQENAPHSGTEDANGMHIGILAPSAGAWAGYFAISPLTTAHLFHAKVTLPAARPTTASGAVDDLFYVQQEMYQNPRIDAIGCGATLYSNTTDWITVWQQGNDKAVTFAQIVYDNPDQRQPTSRDCTLVTDGNDILKSYIDGQQVFSNSSMHLNMPQPFQSYLELQTNSQTSSTGNTFTGTFTDYYATTSDSIKVINARAGSIVKVVDATSGDTLASSTASSDGTAFVDVGRYNLPINANVIVFDSTGTSILASTSSHVGIYGGDVFNIGSSTAPQTTITVNSFDMSSGTPLQGIYVTIASGQTYVAKGFTPLSYSGTEEAEYTIIPQDYGTHIFDHWSDGSKYRAKIIDPITSNINLTAYYLNGDSTATYIEPTTPTIQAGKQIKFTATVKDQYNSTNTPTGAISFDDGNAGRSFSSSECTLNQTGSCTITYTSPATAPRYPITITGTYSPSSTDTIHQGSYGTSALTVTPPASLSLNPTTGAVGTSVTVTGSNFAPSSTMTISYDGTAVSTNPSNITSH